MKVHEYAKEHDMTSADVVRLLKSTGIDGVTHAMHEIPDEMIDLIQSIPKKKPATKPWNASENPWVPDLLRVKNKEQRLKEGFRCKWVSPDNFQRSIEQGWKVADKKDYGGLQDTLPGEESKDGSVVKRRELILMETTEENWQARREFFKRKTKNITDGAQQLAKDQGKRSAAESGGGLELTESRFTTQ